MNPAPIVIAIAGPSGSGKSMLSSGIQALLGRHQCVVLGIDHCYKDWSHLPGEQRNEINFDQPQALDTVSIVSALARLIEGQSIIFPRYDFSQHARSEIGDIIKPAPLILVEGIFALAIPEIQKCFTQSWYVNLDSDTCLERRLKRDVTERGRDAEEVRSRFERDVRPSIRDWVEPQRKFADSIFDGNKPWERLLEEAIAHLRTLLSAQPKNLIIIEDNPPMPTEQNLAIGARMGMKLLDKRLLKETALPKSGSNLCEDGLRLRRKMRRNQCLHNLLRYTGLSAIGRRFSKQIKLEKNSVFVRNLPTELDGFKILHISDLHPDLGCEWLPSLVELISGEAYHLAVITGDFRNNFQPNTRLSIKKISPLFDALKSPVFAVLGNHDLIEMVSELESREIRVLLNEAVVLQHSGARIWLAGVDDPYFFKTDVLNLALPTEADSEYLRILLAHSPGVYRSALKNFDLLLAGHTHGGQVCLPGGIPIIRNGNCPSRMLAGAWQEGNLQGYTSRGVGCSGASIRFFCPPEVTLHTLSK